MLGTLKVPPNEPNAANNSVLLVKLFHKAVLISKLKKSGTTTQDGQTSLLKPKNTVIWIWKPVK